MQFRNRVSAIGLSIALALPAFGADANLWSNVQSLRLGDRIGIIQSDQKRVEGKFRSATESGLTIETEREITVAKDNVIRVYRRPGLSRKKRVLIGAAVGLAAGGAIAGGIAGGSNNEGFFGGSWTGAAVGVSLVGGAGIGAGVAALTGGGYKTIYQREARP